MEADARDKAMAHCEGCPMCAARLADQRALAAGLRAMAALDASLQAPQRVEDALVAAFRQQTVVSRSRRMRIVWAAAAAAAIIIIFAIVALRFQGATPEKEAERPNQSPVKKESERKLEELAPRIAADSKKKDRRRSEAARKTDRAARAKTADETATAFLPLVDYDSLAMFDGGEIRRVELSRPALISLGLPVNMDRANETVKADLLVGHDGVARAIRFVR
jgi:hypothetical protein